MVNQFIEKTADRDKGIPAAQLKKMQERSGSRMVAPVKSVFRVSRGHNYYTIRLKTESALPQGNQIEGIIALAKTSEKISRNKLKANGFIIGDSKLPLNDPRVVRLVMEEKDMAERTRPGDICGSESGACDCELNHLGGGLIME